MGNKDRYKDAKVKREAGGYVPLSYAVLRSAAFTRLSPYAVKLLTDLLAPIQGQQQRRPVRGMEPDAAARLALQGHAR